MDRTLTGRFYNSFALRMIRDFSLLLALLFVLEMALRLGVALWDFHTSQREATEQAADTLASDIQNIMLNAGGPVASRTVYPIIERNYSTIGYSIAVQPSPVTVSSVKKLFDHDARGIAADWPDGRHHRARRELAAQPFCLSCHVDAKVGQSLGHVEVRRYLADHLANWWHEVRLTGVMMLGKISIDILILYWLLRRRMEPLMTLRATVAALTTSNQGLSRRVQVKSEDEFGELALNLNDLLDRVTTVMSDLLGLLNQVVAINNRLTQSTQQVLHNFEAMDGCVRATRSALHQHMRKDYQQVRDNLQQIRDRLRNSTASSDEQALLGDTAALLEQTVEAALSQLSAIAEPLDQASEAGHDLRHFIQGIGHLEERLTALAEDGRQLLGRLS